jgi:site-specific DNA-methyltransferase (adenine-specific)
MVFLVAARTDTAWWHRYALRGAEIRFIKGRLHYGGSQNPAPFPSAVLVFDRHKRHPVAVSSIEPDRGQAP